MHAASSPTLPSDPIHADARFEALEIKLSYLEDTVETLNRIVYDQQQLLDLLKREVLALRQQSPDGGAPGFRSLRDELPPHY